jgi:energy-coupling factor transporter ATP-binding protein EcfA2
MRRPEDAREILERFERSFAHGTVRQELIHPFDFGNAEEVMDNSLLYSLAAKSFPWRDQIESSSHLLVVGPRGCGKTTVFRSMSFVCLADAGEIDNALSKPYLGLYVSCNKEFRQRFSAIDRQTLLARQDDIRHYFNLIVLREFSSVLVALSNANQIIDADLRAVAAFLDDHCPDLMASKSLNSAADLEGTVTRAVHDSRMAIWTGSPVKGRTNQGFVADLADFVAARLSPFIGKALYLFVDDYTEGKVPKEAQQALNHILFVPNASYKCKISSEVFGVTQDETFGNFLDQDREYKEWNLGTLYCLKLPTREQKAFLKEIVDKRLMLCEYQGRVDSVIGDSRYPDGTLERALKYESDTRKEKRQVAGSNCTLGKRLSIA